MVLITNRQSNILQDIDSLHLFAQVVTSVCKSLDEREILRNAYELLSAFDELVTLGYRENLSLAQIKTFLEMESHEERIQEIISRVCWMYSLDTTPIKLIRLCRTRSLKQPRNANAKLSSWNYNERKWLEVVVLPLLEPHPILHTLHLLDLRAKILTTATRPRRVKLSSKSIAREVELFTDFSH